VTNRADVAMRLRPLKFRFSHSSRSLPGTRRFGRLVNLTQFCA
jgi:hypothetical protein